MGLFGFLRRKTSSRVDTIPEAPPHRARAERHVEVSRTAQVGLVGFDVVLPNDELSQASFLRREGFAPFHGFAKKPEPSPAARDVRPLDTLAIRHDPDTHKWNVYLDDELLGVARWREGDEGEGKFEPGTRFTYPRDGWLIALVVDTGVTELPTVRGFAGDGEPPALVKVPPRPRPEPRTATVRLTMPPGATEADRDAFVAALNTEVEQLRDDAEPYVSEPVKVVRAKVDAARTLDLTPLGGTSKRVVGIGYWVHDRERTKFGKQGTFLLIREPRNEFDQNAVAVLSGSRKIGYLSGAQAARYAPLMDALDADAFSVTGGDFRVTVPSPASLRALARKLAR